MPHTAPLLPSVLASPTKGDAAALPAHPEVRDDHWLPLPPARPAVRTYPAVAPAPTVAPAPVVQARPNLAARVRALAARATATRIDWGICAALMIIAALFRAY